MTTIWSLLNILLLLLIWTDVVCWKYQLYNVWICDWLKEFIIHILQHSLETQCICLGSVVPLAMFFLNKRNQWVLFTIDQSGPNFRGNSFGWHINLIPVPLDRRRPNQISNWIFCQTSSSSFQGTLNTTLLFVLLWKILHFI